MTEISSFSSLTLLQQSLLYCDIHFVVILNLCCDMLFFVMIMFLPVAGICYCDRLFLCRDSVVNPRIDETELYIATDSFYVATESSSLLVVG